MLGDIWVYVEAVIGNWFTGYWALSAVPEVLSYIMPNAVTERATARFDEWISPATRQRFYRALFIAGLFVAGFVAWDDQYQVALSKSPEALTQRLDALEQYKHAREIHEWPTIGTDKIAALVAALKLAGPRSLSIACNDDDCEALAEQIDETAKNRGGWKSHVVSGSIVGIGNGLAFFGPSNLRTTTDQLGDAFQSAIGFPVAIGSPSGIHNDEFWLTIDRRPRP
jgi:hypothetical protein